jgi:hypothetical protein
VQTRDRSNRTLLRSLLTDLLGSHLGYPRERIPLYVVIRDRSGGLLYEEGPLGTEAQLVAEELADEIRSVGLGGFLAKRKWG